MDLNTFSVNNRERCESPQGFNHQLTDWSLSDWMTALTGEVGEAANIVKKLNRIRDNIAGNPTVRICPKCKTVWRHDHIRILKCSCGNDISGMPSVPDPTLEPKLKTELAKELADVYIYLDLFFQRLGISLPDTVAEVFNAKSEQVGSSIKV
jgi:NTP pyrophosphatase (non-canonical NTP hydrolase)